MNRNFQLSLILPNDHIVSNRIVRHAHQSTLHGTNQETAMLINQRFHLIKAKSLIIFIINRCVICFRHRCSTQEQQMSSLPPLRVTSNRRFLNCGVDFAGPFDLKRFTGRCNSTYKTYFAIFVCCLTKACYWPYRYSIYSRMVRNLFSDCRTNFIAARTRVTRSLSEVQQKWNEEIASKLSEDSNLSGISTTLVHLILEGSGRLVLNVSSTI